MPPHIKGREGGREGGREESTVIPPLVFQGMGLYRRVFCAIQVEIVKLASDIARQTKWNFLMVYKNTKKDTSIFTYSTGVISFTNAVWIHEDTQNVTCWQHVGTSLL